MEREFGLLAKEAAEHLTAATGRIEEILRRKDALLSSLSIFGGYDREQLQAFLQRPWCILPKSKDEWRVIVPRCCNISVGWLEQTTEVYNIFVVNRFSRWITDVPAALREELAIPEGFTSIVQDGRLSIDDGNAAKFKHHLKRREGEGLYSITRGHEFQLIADLIEAGSMPFSATPVAPADLQQHVRMRWSFALREYQKKAWEQFLSLGAVGIYWPFGQGKTVIGAWALAQLRGPKLIVVPTRTLVDQWRARIKSWCPYGTERETVVITYNSWNKVKSRKWTLTIFDEAHRLPANTFARLATIQTKYRIGLTGTPYREDGRASYIFGLTGHPIGFDWSEFIASGKLKLPSVDVHIVPGWLDKIRHVESTVAANPKAKTIIYCDGIARGHQLAQRLSCPFIHGQTTSRIEKFTKERLLVVSRVGDEGVSIPDLDLVIEADFHGKSRRQEAQRAGRLFHSEKAGRHTILMTELEYEKYHQRLLALEERGMRVTVTTARKMLA